MCRRATSTPRWCSPRRSKASTSCRGGPSADAPTARALCHWATRRGLLDWPPNGFPGPHMRGPRDRRGADARIRAHSTLLPPNQATKVCLFGAVREINTYSNSITYMVNADRFEVHSPIDAAVDVGRTPMLRKALAACASAAILLCVGVFDSAPADAQGYARAYRGGAGVGIYRGPRGGVAIGAGYRGGAGVGIYRGPRGGV